MDVIIDYDHLLLGTANIIFNKRFVILTLLTISAAETASFSKMDESARRHLTGSQSHPMINS